MKRASLFVIVVALAAVAAPASAGPKPPTDSISGGSQYTPLSPEQLATMRAESNSEQKISKLVKAGNLASAMVECKSALAASATAHGGVPVPRLRHFLGAIYLAQGRFADACRVFEDIGHHNGEVYSCDDFDLDVALAAANLGKLPRAQALVSKYLSRFQTWQGRTELLPGFGSSLQAIASVRAVRGMNKVLTAQWAEGAGELDLAAQLAPHNAYVLCMRGAALSFVDRFSEAKSSLEEAARSGIPDLSQEAELRLASVHAAAQVATPAGK
jgi:tetratricopeptide (TPR) repeat protein